VEDFYRQFLDCKTSNEGKKISLFFLKHSVNNVTTNDTNTLFQQPFSRCVMVIQLLSWFSFSTYF